MSTRSPKVLLVCCHPNPQSFTYAVFHALHAGLRAGGCEAQTLELYAEGFDPVLVVNEVQRRRDLDKVQYTQRHRDLVRNADAMLLVYPLWWGSFPAMLKGFLDRVFVSGEAYSFAGLPRTAVLPKGLLAGKQLHCFYTLDAPTWVARFDPGWAASYFSVFQYCGYSVVQRHYLAALKHSTLPQRQAWLATVQQRATRLAGELTKA